MKLLKRRNKKYISDLKRINKIDREKKKYWKKEEESMHKIKIFKRKRSLNNNKIIIG